MTWASVMTGDGDRQTHHRRATYAALHSHIPCTCLRTPRACLLPRFTCLPLPAAPAAHIRSPHAFYALLPRLCRALRAPLPYRLATTTAHAAAPLYLLRCRARRMRARAAHRLPLRYAARCTHAPHHFARSPACCTVRCCAQRCAALCRARAAMHTHTHRTACAHSLPIRATTYRAAHRFACRTFYLPPLPPRATACCYLRAHCRACRTPHTTCLRRVAICLYAYGALPRARAHLPACLRFGIGWLDVDGWVGGCFGSISPFPYLPFPFPTPTPPHPLPHLPHPPPPHPTSPSPSPPCSPPPHPLPLLPTFPSLFFFPHLYTTPPCLCLVIGGGGVWVVWLVVVVLAACMHMCWCVSLVFWWWVVISGTGYGVFVTFMVVDGL